MGFFSKCASWLWNGAKRAVAAVWNHVVKPAATKVLSWLGVSSATVERGCAVVESVTKRAVVVLETSVGELVSAALDRLEQRLSSWLLERHGRLGDVIAVTLERLRDLRHSDRKMDEEVFTIVRPSIAKSPITRDLEK